MSTTTLFAIIDGETGRTWNPNQVCDGGDGRGLVCINKRFYPEEYVEALDPVYSMRFAAKLLSKGEEYKFTLCSCIQTAKMLGVPIPKGMSAKDISANGSAGAGDLLLFEYSDGERHVAKILSVDSNLEFYMVKEGNYKKCTLTTRKVYFNDPTIIGGWSPSSDG